MSAVQSNKLIVFTSCFVITMLSLEILIGFFIYKSVQNDVQNKINSETRKCVCKEEFRHLISDKENWRQLYDFVVYINSRRRRAVAPFKKRVGSPGPPGPPGPTGPGGPPGASGTPGPPGPPGLGLEGPIGPPGLQGPSGLPGSEGSVGRPGNGGPIGVPGVAGKDGIPGQNGENGHPGRDGIPGEKGAKGEQGVSGLPGLLGPMGVEGTKGDKGEVGWMGAKGERGETGEPGVVGKPGEKGVCGSTGPPGERGPKGTPGPEGPPGSSSKCSFCEEEPDHIGIENRLTEYTIRFARTDCVSLAIGRKEYFGLADGSYTTFMIDSSPPKESNFGRFWATTHDNTQLLEFQDAIMLTFNNPSRIYNLEIPFDGNSLVVHDGFLFYKMSGQIPKIIRYDLGNHMTISLLIPGFEKCKMKPLYLSGTNYIDLSIDQNGLWAIFTRADSDSTIVMKIDHNDMTIVYTWEVSLNNKHVIDTFIAAGTLYTLQFSPTFEIEINLTINLLSTNVTKLHIKGIEQTGGITAVSYDYKNEQLLIVDGRKRIIYPFYCDDQGLLTTYVRSE